MNDGLTVLSAIASVLIYTMIFHPWPSVGRWRRMAWCKKCHRRVESHQAKFDDLCRCGAGVNSFGFPHREYTSRLVRDRWFGPTREEIHQHSDTPPEVKP